MKIKNLILFVLISVILSGLTTIVYVSVFDKEATTRLLDQNQVKIPETHTAASIPKTTILLLLAVGVIGVLGVSRNKKALDDPAEEKEMIRTFHNQDSNE
jgi:hypothetical protein